MGTGRGRSGRPWERRKAEIKAQHDIRCWRCGKQLSAEYTWPHPLSVTIGHIIALEDGGDPLAPENTAPECIACNQGDGARRTNAKRQGIEHADRISYKNPRWSGGKF